MDAYDYDVSRLPMWSGRFPMSPGSIEDFKALPLLQQQSISGADGEKSGGDHEKSFWKYGIYFTPLYIANYCQNYCIYCGFNCYNNIRRKKLSFEEIEHEMQVIAKTGMEGDPDVDG